MVKHLMAALNKDQLNGILDIGEVAYKEEQERKKLLIEQSNSIIIVITLLSTLFGIILSVAVEKISADLLSIIYISFLLIFLVLMSSLTCALIVQWRVKYHKFMNAIDFFKDVQENQDKYIDEKSFIKKKISGYGDTAKEIASNNDKRVKLIKASHILVFICIYIAISTIITCLIVFYI